MDPDDGAATLEKSIAHAPSGVRTRANANDARTASLRRRVGAVDEQGITFRALVFEKNASAHKVNHKFDIDRTQC